MSSVPIIDLSPWFDGDSTARAAVAAQVDAALSEVGFLLVTGHGVATDLRRTVREQARTFFALPESVKARYAVTVGGRGWLPPGVESNGYADPYSTSDSATGSGGGPDLKESFAVGADTPTGDADVDAVWFLPNVWPDEAPGLRAAVSEYLSQMKALATALLELAAAAIGSDDKNLFTRQTSRATHTMNINRYPSLDVTGPPQPGQFRIGPHTDFGTVTILDREAGRGGLQVWNERDGWEDAPFHPDALTINTGDLLARWSGDRWRSNRHRVLPPQAEAPDEDLLSLVYFYEADHDAVIESLQPPLGRANGYPPVVSGEFILQRLNAITVG